MSVVVAYDMYREMATETAARQAFDIGDDEKFKVLDFHDFRDRLAKQGLVYSLLDCRYPGNNNMRANTRKTIAKRKTMVENEGGSRSPWQRGCLLNTSDPADEEDSLKRGRFSPSN